MVSFLLVYSENKGKVLSFVVIRFCSTTVCALMERGVERQVLIKTLPATPRRLKLLMV